MAALSTTLLAASAVLSIGGQVASGIGARRAAADTAAEGARLGADAVARGEQDVRRYTMDLGRLLGRQRAVAGATGLDVNQGSAAALRTQTEAFGQEDIRTIRENALREAYSLRRSGQNQAAALRSQATAQFAGAFGTALSFGARGWEVYQQGQRTRLAANTAIASDAFRRNPAMF